MKYNNLIRLMKRHLGIGLLPILIVFQLNGLSEVSWGQSTQSNQSNGITAVVESSSSPPPPPSSPDTVDLPAESQFVQDYAAISGPFFGEISTNADISSELGALSSATRTRQAVLHVLSTQQGLKLILVTANSSDAQAQVSHQDVLVASQNLSTAHQHAPRKLAQNEVETNSDVFVALSPDAKPEKLKATAKTFRNRVSSPIDLESKSYLESSQQLYQWIIKPLEERLAEKSIDTLIFILDEGLRTIPVAALHDGNQFLVERYNLAVAPSFSLTDTRYRPIQGAKMLGMGIAQSVEGLSELPSVEVEVPTLTNEIWSGEPYLNQLATVDRLETLTKEKKFNIIHLATHAEFNRGQVSNSFIQLWDRKLTFTDLRTISAESNWNQDPTIELLVLSACQTALGSKEAELGFTGLALQTGVKSVLGSLWFVSDDGTLALMSEFYTSLGSAPIKAAALRDAQMAMVNGQTKIENGVLKLSSGLEIKLKTGQQNADVIQLSHPYYWSPFTLVGNWN